MSNNPFINQNENNQKITNTTIPQIHIEETTEVPLDPPPEYSEFDPIGTQQAPYLNTQSYSRPAAQVPIPSTNNWSPVLPVRPVSPRLPARPVSPRLPARPDSGAFPGTVNVTYNNVNYNNQSNPPLPPRRF